MWKHLSLQSLHHKIFSRYPFLQPLKITLAERQIKDDSDFTILNCLLTLFIIHCYCFGCSSFNLWKALVSSANCVFDFCLLCHPELCFQLSNSKSGSNDENKATKNQRSISCNTATKTVVRQKKPKRKRKEKIKTLRDFDERKLYFEWNDFSKTLY